MPLQWEQFGKSHIALDGKRIVAMVGSPEGAPCEMFSIQILVDTFMTLEDAKEEAQKIHAEIQRELAVRKNQPPSFGDLLESVLKQALAALEAEKAKRLPAASSLVGES